MYTHACAKAHFYNFCCSTINIVSSLKLRTVDLEDARWLLVWFRHELIKLDQTSDDVVVVVYPVYVVSNLKDWLCCMVFWKS